MIVGIGLDIVEIQRIQHIVTRQQKFVDRILTVREKQRFNSLAGDIGRLNF